MSKAERFPLRIILVQISGRLHNHEYQLSSKCFLELPIINVYF